MGLWDALAGIGSTFATNISNRAINDENNRVNIEQAQLNREFQADQAQNQMDFQERMYKDYQSPQALVSQYQEAGLNPALMMSKGAQASGGNFSGAAGSGSAATSAGMIPMQSPIDALTLSQARKNDADARKTNSENDQIQAALSRYDEIIDAEIANKNASTEDIRAAKSLKELDYDQKNELFPLVKQAHELTLKLDNQKFEIGEEEKQNLIEQRNLILKQIDGIASNIRVNYATIKNLNADTSLKGAQKENVQADTDLKGAERENIQADTDLKGSQKNTTDSQNELNWALIFTEDVMRHPKYVDAWATALETQNGGLGRFRNNPVLNPKSNYADDYPLRSGTAEERAERHKAQSDRRHSPYSNHDYYRDEKPRNGK